MQEGNPQTIQERERAWQRAKDAWTNLNQGQRQGFGGQAQQQQGPTTTSDYLKTLGYLLRQSHNVGGRRREDTAPIAVILDYTEKLIPYHLGEGRGDRDQLQALETVQRWGLDTQLRYKTENIVILLTTNIGQIAAGVYAGGSGCRAIRYSLTQH